MSGLMGMLSLAARSLDAQRFGLDVTGQNIANVNTAGYTKRVAELADVPPPDKWTAGGGVEIVGVRSMRDRLIDRRLWGELSDQEGERARSEQLGVAEVALGSPGESIDGALDDFFDAFATLADTPTSPVARQEVIMQGRELASTFANTAERLAASRHDADVRIRAGVEEVNALAKRIADLNVQLAGTAPTSGEGLHLRDEANRAVEELAGLLNINVIERDGGGFDIDFAGGHPLVIGQFSYAVEVVDAPVTGLAQLRSGTDDVTAGVTSGALGGLFDVRDVRIPDYSARLDALAFDVATAVNALHASGFDLSGTPGVAFFQPVALAGAASSLVMNPALTASGGDALIAASASATAAGDNQVARRLAGLRDQKITAGGTSTAAEAWSQLVYRAGRDRAAAFDAERTQTEVTRQIRNLQDGVSGVSLDEEAADLIRFQRAYEANARFFTTIDETLSTLLNMV